MSSLEELEKELKAQENRIKEIKKKVSDANKEEVLKAAQKRTLSDGEKSEIRATFDEFDTDKSGFIDRDELKKCVAKLGAQMSEEELDEAVKALDANEDGKISFDEFTEWFTSDKKLGGNSGVQLQIVKAKMRAMQAANNVKKQLARAKRMGKLKKEGGGAASLSPISLSARMVGKEYKSKMSVGVTLLPSTKSTLTAAHEEAIKAGCDADELDVDSRYRSGLFRMRFKVGPSFDLDEFKTKVKATLSSYDPMPPMSFEDGILKVYIPKAEFPVDSMLSNMYQVDSDDDEAEPSKYMQPMAASASVANDCADFAKQKSTICLHNLLEGLSVEAKGASSYSGIEAMIVQLAQMDGWSAKRRQRRLIPRLYAAAGLQSSENELTFTDPDIAVSRVANELARGIREWVQSDECKSHIDGEEEDYAAALKFVDTDDFLLFCRRKFALSIKSGPLFFFALPALNELYGEKGFYDAFKYAKDTFEGVAGATFFGKVGSVQLTFDNFNPFEFVLDKSEVVGKTPNDVDGGDAELPPKLFDLLGGVEFLSELEPFTTAVEDL